MFLAFKNGHQGKETVHDVYCSACGVMIARSRNNAEGGQPDIFLDNYAMFKKGSESDIKEGDASKDSKEYVRVSIQA